MKKTLLIGMLLVLALTACQPAAPAATQAPAVTQAAATTEAPTATTAITEAPVATEAMTEAPTATTEVTEAPAATAAMTESASTTQSAGAVTCSLTTEQEQALATAGKDVFTATCVACHGAEGQGQGNFPALAGNTDIQSADPSQLIQTLTNPQIHPFADQLNNQQVAGVLSYVRSAFGNTAAAICLEQVNAIRPGK